MATQIPLVLIGGVVQQLPSGDTVGGVPATTGADVSIRVSASANQDLPANATTVVAYDTTNHDVGSLSFDNATDLITIGEAGTYHLTSSLRLQTPAVGAISNARLTLEVDALGNNSWAVVAEAISTATLATSTEMSLAASTDWVLATGARVRTRVFYNSTLGGTLRVLFPIGAEPINNMAVHRIGGAKGDAGAAGAAGVGVPAGGTTGQVLTKVSNTDFDTAWQTPAGGGSEDIVVLSADQTTTANTDAASPNLNGMSWTLGPGQAIRMHLILISRTSDNTRGVRFGVKVVHGAGANGNVLGSWNGSAAIGDAANDTRLSDGDVISAAASSTTYGSLSASAGSTSANQSNIFQATLRNFSTNANATVSFFFGGEASSTATITARAGSAGHVAISP